MPIEDTKFGSITIDGKTYDHDVIIRLSGKVEKRRKKLSKEKYGTSHLVSKEEAKFDYEEGCDLLIVDANIKPVHLVPSLQNRASRAPTTAYTAMDSGPLPSSNIVAIA
jgi:hypothetical protein